MDFQEHHCRRKERRFKTSDSESLRCDTTIEQEELRAGTVIDISPSGLRFLSCGRFQVGQSFSTELITDRSHGTYRGTIRRVEPWTGGQTVLGCQLIDPIPQIVLQDLAREGVVNRRSDQRVDWNQRARLSWELHQGEIDVEIQDCSTGGLKVCSEAPIPDDVQVRILVDMGGEEPMVIDARTVWKLEQGSRFLSGLAFIHKAVPEAVRRILESDGRELEIDDGQRSPLRRGVMIATAVAVLGLSLWQIGVFAR